MSAERGDNAEHQDNEDINPAQNKVKKRVSIFTECF